MIRVILPLCFLMVALNLAAQITIERDDFILSPNDTVLFWVEEDPSLIEFPTAGIDQVWDYRNLAFDPNSNFRYLFTAGTSPELPDANIVGSSRIPTSLDGVFFDVAFQAVVDEQGYRTIGRIDEAEKVSLAAMTGGPTDSINFVRTVNEYASPVWDSQFPLRYEDEILGDLELRNNFLLSVAAFGLNNVPGSAAVLTAMERKTTGWGKLLVTNPVDGQEIELDVLLVEDVSTLRDTFTLAGAPAPDALLQAFGLAQGRERERREYFFWAKDYRTAVLRFYLSPEGLESVELNKNIRQVISSTRQVDAPEVSLQVAPNPSSDYCSVVFDKPETGVWTLRLFNALGQAVKTQRLVEGRGMMNQNLELSHLPAGIFHLVLMDESGAIRGREKISIR